MSKISSPRKSASPAPFRAVNAHAANSCIWRWCGQAWPSAFAPSIQTLRRTRSFRVPSWPAIAVSMWRTCSGRRHGDLSELDRQVAQSLATHETLAANVEEDFEEKRTLGERLSDHLASFGGSWMFIVGFGIALPSGSSST